MSNHRLASLAIMVFCSTPAAALEFDFHDIGITWNNRLTVGAGMRVEERDPDLLGKLNLNPELCAGDDCLSFQGDPEPNQRLVDAPGAFFADKQDDGNWNYDQGDVFSALAKVTSDLSMSWGDFTFKTRVIAFFDEINYDFDEFHPNNNTVVDPASGVGGYQPEFTRRDEGTEDLYGANVRLQDLSLNGTFFIGSRLLSVGVGAQRVRWGESNLIALNSLNEINPPDIRGLRQPGGQINEIFQPTPMVLVSGDIMPDWGITGEAFYQLQWERVQADPGGTFFGELDALYREGPYSYGAINLGQFPDDPIQDECNGTEQDRPRGCHRLQDPTADLLTDTSFSARVLQRAGEPDDQGQYGLRINWFADMINNGTEFGFYAMNYHSRLPYLSFFAADRSPLRDGTGTALDILTSCQTVGNECFPVDTAVTLVDYPEDIQMYGLSFNTNIGSWSVAGEYSFRPNLPVQVSMPDVFFAALQPALPEDDIVVPLLGITVPSARSAVPDYVETIYRGNGDVDQNIAERGENYYIPGWDRQKVGQLIINGIRILGSSNFVASAIRAEQIIMLLEAGVTHVVDLPSRDQIQFDGGSPNRTHFSGGADGTGQPNGEPDPRSLNPTQQTDTFVDEYAWGYRGLLQFEYNDVFLGVNLKPFIIFAHDVEGYAPAPMQNFLEDRIEYVLGTEWFLGQRLSGRIQYNGHDGNRHNIRRDKDNVMIDVSYTF